MDLHVSDDDNAMTLMSFMVIHIIRVRLLQVCSFYSDGQFQGLKQWNELQVWLSRLLFIILEHSEESPEAYNSE